MNTFQQELSGSWCDFRWLERGRRKQLEVSVETL